MSNVKNRGKVISEGHKGESWASNYELPNHYARYLDQRKALKDKEQIEWKKRLAGYRAPSKEEYDKKNSSSGPMNDIIANAIKRREKYESKKYKSNFDENDISYFDPNFLTTEQKLKVIKYIKLHPRDPIIRRLVEEKIGGSMQGMINHARMKQQAMMSDNKWTNTTLLEKYLENLKKDKSNSYRKKYLEYLKKDNTAFEDKCLKKTTKK